MVFHAISLLVDVVLINVGTTGLPKGVLREAGGHAVGLNLSIRYIFGIRGPGDVMFVRLLRVLPG